MKSEIGIDFRTEPVRFYPHRTLAAQVLGFSGVDGRGLDGLEFYYDAFLGALRACLEPWAKTFQNLRSTRETELFKLTSGNIKAVCTWIGNSPEVALKHYAQITEADSREAAKLTVMNSGKNAEKTKACDSLRDAGLMIQMGWAGFEPAKAYANGFTARPL